MTIKDRNYLDEYRIYLHEEERSVNTVKKYIRDITKFLEFNKDVHISKINILEYKEYLIENYAPSSANSMIAALNGFLEWLGYESLKVRPIKIQKNIFSSPEKELTVKEYERLIRAAEQNNNEKLSLIIQTICSTGIRVSELKYIEYESLVTCRVSVSCKGKNRLIFLPKELCVYLKKYCKENNIKKGSIFITKNGKAMDRSNIWKMMKQLCKDANVEQEKVFPHNLRHLFARTYYTIEKDISRLADILGYTSINTTRIYTMETGIKHAKQIDKMNLICLKKITT